MISLNQFITEAKKSDLSNLDIFGKDSLSTLDIIEALNMHYAGDRMRFEITNEDTDNYDFRDVGISYSALMSNGDIYVYLLADAWSVFEDNYKMYGKPFSKYFSEVVQSIQNHENVHKKYGVNRVNPSNVVKYLSEKVEIKAQARSIVDEYIRKNYSKKQILSNIDKFDASDNEHFSKYTKYFDESDDVIQKLFDEIKRLLK